MDILNIKRQINLYCIKYIILKYGTQIAELLTVLLRNYSGGKFIIYTNSQNTYIYALIHISNLSIIYASLSDLLMYK